MKASNRRLLKELLTLPTSPFHEQHIVEYVKAWAARQPHVRMNFDAFGNIHLRTGPASKNALLLVAHMDHPGFEAQRMSGKNRLTALWRGGVSPEYFPKARVRFFVDGKWIRGVIEKITVVSERGRRRVRTAIVQVNQPVQPGAIGMWDLPDPVVRGSRIYARGCDDIAGLTSILATFEELARRRSRAPLEAILTRAEEVGFAGALAAVRENGVSKQARIISIECSSELAGGKMGEGPILRVGDYASIFTPELTAFCRSVGQDIARRDAKFKFQRKLMDGGTCEASAFCGHGLQASGLCIALGNYHNMDRRRQRIDSEYVDLNDFDGLVRWLVALVTSQRKPTGDLDLRAALDRLHRQYTPLLRRTAQRVRNGG
jgi:putative aminopeptidase FrvX